MRALKQFLHIHCLFECSGHLQELLVTKGALTTIVLCASSQVRRDLGSRSGFVPSFWLNVSLTFSLLNHRSVTERMALGAALHMFPCGSGLPRSKWIFGFAFKVAWPRCGRTPLAYCWCRGARASKQELKVVRGALTSNTLPSLVAAARRQAVWRRRTGSVTFISGPEIELSCAFVCDVCFRHWSS